MEIRMKEEDIRKRVIFNSYLKLVERDAREFFDPRSFVEINCPACNGRRNTFEFEKSEFKYVSCKNCKTLFVNPRPLLETLKDFYSKSSSTDFWINEFFKPVAEARREKIFVPRAKYISEMLSPNKKLLIGDIGAGFGLFLEELRKILPNGHYIAIEPSGEMARFCREKGLEVKCAFLEEVRGMEESFGLLSAFELVEHLFDPVNFFKRVYALLKSGGYLYFSTLNSMGFDILLLWEKSKSIAAPHHLNFFNTKSVRHLLERLGFEVIKISTPGRLDWDIAEGMIKYENIDLGKFWNLLANEGSDELKEELQDWIAKNGLSSHMEVLVKKR